MTKKSLFYPQSLLILCLVSMLSCKKQIENTSKNFEPTLKYQRWFEDSLMKKERQKIFTDDSLPTNNFHNQFLSRLEKLNNEAKWEHSKSFQVLDRIFVYVPLESNLNPFSNKNFQASRSLIFYQDRLGNCQMDIIEIISDKGEIFNSNLKEVAINAVLKKNFPNLVVSFTNDLNANVLFYDQNYMPTHSYRISKGGWSKSSFSLQNEKRKITNFDSTPSFAESNCRNFVLIGYWYDLETGEILSWEILDSWTECLEGTGGDSGGGGSWGATPEDEIPAPVAGTLCQYYNFKTVGQAYVASIKDLEYTLAYVNLANRTSIFRIRFPGCCLSMPKYNITDARASEIFDVAFNFALRDIVDELNVGVLVITGAKSRLKILIQQNLSNLLPGATFSTLGYCDGDIPVTTITPSSFCP